MKKRFFYDLHLHSCLSPCGDNESTPASCAGIAKLNGLDIVALTDHNSAKNCQAFCKACDYYGIIPIPGIEVTTSEDVHMVCLFKELTKCLNFDGFLSSKRNLIKNRPEIFGEQLIVDENDEILAKEEYLLTNATSLSIDELYHFVTEYGGVCFPAHIDRSANGIISTLGTIPPNPNFGVYEMRNSSFENEYREKYFPEGKNLVFSSDAHCLCDIGSNGSYVELEAEKNDKREVICELFKYLNGEI